MLQFVITSQHCFCNFQVPSPQFTSVLHSRTERTPDLNFSNISHYPLLHSTAEYTVYALLLPLQTDDTSTTAIATATAPSCAGIPSASAGSGRMWTSLGRWIKNHLWDRVLQKPCSAQSPLLASKGQQKKKKRKRKRKLKKYLKKYNQQQKCWTSRESNSGPPLT